MGRFIVIEGLIGVGKSTLARLIASEWGARAVLEPNEQNPFLEPFYRDPERYAFPAQMFYLSTRWKQQEAIRQGHLFQSDVVSDYLFIKDRLFAEKTLADQELELYGRFASVLTEQAPVPDLLIWLEADLDTVMARIEERQAPGEDAIERPYLEDLLARYRQLLGEWTDSPLLVIDNRAMDYRQAPGQQQVLERIRLALEGGDSHSSVTPGSTIVDREDQPALFGGGGQ